LLSKYGRFALNISDIFGIVDKFGRREYDFIETSLCELVLSFFISGEETD